MSKDKPFSQTHHLVINQDNEFNKIYNSLSEIENIIDIMDGPVKKIERLLEHQRKTIQNEWKEIRGLKGSEREIRKKQIKKLVSNELTDLELYKFNYVQIIETMLHILTIQIDDKIHSDKDLQILYTKVIKLIRKISQVKPDFHTMELINHLINNMSETRSNEDVRLYAEKHEINLKVANNLIASVENFKKQFLSEQKEDKDYVMLSRVFSVDPTAEPHEKSR